MIISKQIALVILVTLLPWFSHAQQLAEVSVKVKVVDEAGMAVSNAIVGVGFEQGGNAWIGEHKGQNIKGESDSNGCFFAEAKCTGSLGVSAKKEGYYDWWSNFYFYRLGEKHDGDWKPFDPKQNGVTAVLRKIGNPVPMYAKKVRLGMPVLNEPVGYDLTVGDWVSPHGKGEVADFIFLMNSRVAGWKDFETHLAVTFTNALDGIQTIAETGPTGSTFRLPRSARESDYHPSWTNSLGYVPGTGSFQTQAKDCPGYLFRVRSVVDEKGNLLRAMYGKIKGLIQFDGRDSKTGTLSFVYYLNPTPNDRNLEFDPTKNLFTGLSSREEVREP